jgi:hypothetical protein
MRYSRTIRIFLFALGLAGAALGAASAYAAQAETYEWSASLVSFDAASGTAILQERVEAHAAIDGLDDFAEGERLTLVWTGRSWAAGIRDLVRDSDLDPEVLALRVEFVSSERDGRYINFRVKLPADSVDRIAAIGPGARVTGVSPRAVASWDQSVIALRPYNEIG